MGSEFATGAQEGCITGAACCAPTKRFLGFGSRSSCRTTYWHPRIQVPGGGGAPPVGYGVGEARVAAGTAVVGNGVAERPGAGVRATGVEVSVCVRVGPATGGCPGAIVRMIVGERRVSAGWAVEACRGARVSGGWVVETWRGATFGTRLGVCIGTKSLAIDPEFSGSAPKSLLAEARPRRLLDARVPTMSPVVNASKINSKIRIPLPSIRGGRTRREFRSRTRGFIVLTGRRTENRTDGGVSL